MWAYWTSAPFEDNRVLLLISALMFIVNIPYGSKITFKFFVNNPLWLYMQDPFCPIRPNSIHQAYFNFCLDSDSRKNLK